MKNKSYLAFIIIAFIIFPTIAQAMSLSTLQKKNFAEIKQGETAEFTVLFWNIEEPIPISLKLKRAPDNWVIIIKPQEFSLNKSKIGPPYDGDEYIGIPGIGDVEVFPVKVSVNVPKSASLGKYETFVTVRAGEPSSGISILQERTFKFTIYVKKVPTFFETTGKTLTDALNTIAASGKEVVNKLTGMFSSFDSLTISLLSIIIILIVFWVIYKYV